MNREAEGSFCFNQRDFAKILGVVRSFTGDKPRNIVDFSLDKGGLNILATDKGINLTSLLPTIAGETERRSFLADIRPISRIVSSLDNPKVECGFSKNNHLQIGSGGFSADLRISPIKDIKDEELLKETRLVFSIPVADFLEATKKVIFAASDYYSGFFGNILLKIRNDHLVFVASDGHRLSEKLTEGRGFPMGIDEETEILVPKIGLQKLRKLLEKTSQNENNQLNFYLDKEKRRIIFSFANYKMSCECSRGRYPDYKRLFPSRWRVKAILRTEEMVTAAEQASTLKPVRLEFDIENSRLNLTAENNNGETYKTSLAIEGKGKDTKIDLTPGYVLDFLRSIDSELMNITIAGSRRPVVFSPVGDKHYNHLIMPRSA